MRRPEGKALHISKGESEDPPPRVVVNSSGFSITGRRLFISLDRVAGGFVASSAGRKCNQTALAME